MIPGRSMACLERLPRLLLQAFQQARGITADGIVGKVTWINIDEADQSEPVFQSEPVLKIGSTGLPVRRAQKRMSLVGYDVGGVDGRYGTRTEAAVKKLQQQRGLAVDGAVGPQTWSVIDALENERRVSCKTTLSTLQSLRHICCIATARQSPRRIE